MVEIQTFRQKSKFWETLKLRWKYYFFTNDKIDKMEGFLIGPREILKEELGIDLPEHMTVRQMDFLLEYVE